MGQLLPCLLYFIQSKISLFRFSTGFCLISKKTNTELCLLGVVYVHKALPLACPMCVNNKQRRLGYINFLGPGPCQIQHPLCDAGQIKINRNTSVYRENKEGRVYILILVTLNRGKHTHTTSHHILNEQIYAFCKGLWCRKFH